MSKSRRMRLAGHVARMGRRDIHSAFCMRKPEGNKPLVRSRISWGVILKLIVKELGGRDWIVFVWLRIGISGESL
jgi:hypothetical protein